MNRIVRRTLAPVALLGLALALTVAGPVAGADPTGIVLDGTLSVSFREPSPDGGATPGAPVGGARVQLAAYLTDFIEDPAIQVLEATTDAAGSASFTGVARPDAGGPDVYLAFDAFREVRSEDEELCAETRSWSGNVIDVPSLPAEPVAIVANPASSKACRVLAGRIVDADGDAHASAPGLSFVSVELPDGGGARAFPLVVSADGTFRQPLPVWGSMESPAVVSLTFVSETTRRAVVGDCVRSFAESASWEGMLALEFEDPKLLEIVSTEVAGSACGVVSGTPRPPAAPAAPTLPPTDAAGSLGGGHASGSRGSLVLVLGLLLAVGGAAAAVGSAAVARRRPTSD